MRRRLILSPTAERDLVAAWVYVGEHDLRAADRVVRQLRATMRLLVLNPRMGRQRDDLRPGLRSFPHGRYLIFYRESAAGIEVVRVVRGERDVDTLFGH